MMETEDELEKLKNNIIELKRKNLIINEYKKEIEELKKQFK